MIRAFDTIVTRSILVSLIGITLVHILSLWSYEHALDRELTIAHESRLAERLITIKRSVMLVPVAEREPAAHALSGGPIEAHWSSTKAAIAGGPGGEAWQSLGAQILSLAPELSAVDIVIGSSSVVDPHIALVSIRLPDDSWINVSLFAATRPRASGHGTLLSTSLMALGVVLLSVLIARWLTRPIRTIAEAVSSLTPGAGASIVSEAGPREVRDLAAAFNDMQRRIQDLIERRTQSLAAVSHDLRTPLTRLRLRIEDLSDASLRQSISTDIGEMEMMIDSTLSYLSGEETTEASRSIDLVAVLETIVDNFRDAGHSCVLHAPSHLVMEGRLIGLKRAFSNLVGNAVRFGSKVDMSLAIAGGRIQVAVEDDGPGIPADKLQSVLEPFVRLEDSRNRDTGGVGLGLTIAKANIEANGGTLELSNRASGGLRALVTLPAHPSRQSA